MDHEQGGMMKEVQETCLLVRQQEEVKKTSTGRCLCGRRDKESLLFSADYNPQLHKTPSPLEQHNI